MAQTPVVGPVTGDGQTIQLEGLAMHYREYGAGQPLVLLHGFGGSGRNWDPFIAELSPHYRLLLVDLPGHGGSGDPHKDFTHGAAARDVFRLLDRLAIDTFSAMGVSSGGMTLLHMATTQPERIDAMVLVSTTTHFPDQARAIMRRTALRTMPEPVLAMYRACATRGDAQIGRLIAQFNALADNHDDMVFSVPQLSAITARTLVVHGDRDNFFPLDIPIGLYRAIPDAALWIIPGGDHAALFDPAIPFAATALRFLAGAGGGPDAAGRTG